jgi:hypothetical protein
MITIKGTFDDRARIANIVNALLDQHFNPEEIRVHVISGGAERRVPIRFKTKVTPFSALGAIPGAIVGTVVAVLASLEILPTFGIEVFPESVALAATQGFLAGGALFGFIGFIAGLGVWRIEPLLEDSDLRDGHVSISVGAGPARVDAVRDAFERMGARDLDTSRADRA